MSEQAISNGRRGFDTASRAVAKLISLVNEYTSDEALGKIRSGLHFAYDQEENGQVRTKYLNLIDGLRVLERMTPVPDISKLEDPASKLLQDLQSSFQTDALMPQLRRMLKERVLERASMSFGPGYYPDGDPFVTINGKAIVLLTGSAVFINGEPWQCNYAVNEKMMKKGHPLYIAHEAVDMPDGQNRWVKAFWYQEGALVRYWMHRNGDKDHQAGALHSVLRGGALVRITREEYDRLMGA